MLCLLPAPALCAGLFEDFTGLSVFILSSRQKSVTATFARTEDDNRDASIFILNALYPLKSHFMVQAEQPYVTVSTPKGLESGFGDFRIRVRTRMLTRPGTSLFLLTCFRSGSGSRGVFPFASGSIDVEVGAAIVDTLSAFSILGAATAATVWREPKKLDEASAHGNHVTFSVGISFPVRSGLDMRFIGSGYILTSGAVRELYAVSAFYRASRFATFFGSLQAEGGKQSERVIDFAGLVGAQIEY